MLFRSKQVYTNIGNIDYDKGSLNIATINVADYSNSTGIVVYSKPNKNDIAANNYDLIEIDTNSIDITVKTS